MSEDVRVVDVADNQTVKSKFESLPSELLIRIFSYLNYVDLLVLEQVNHYIAHLISSPLIWHEWTGKSTFWAGPSVFLDSEDYRNRFSWLFAPVSMHAHTPASNAVLSMDVLRSENKVIAVSEDCKINMWNAIENYKQVGSSSLNLDFLHSTILKTDSLSKKIWISLNDKVQEWSIDMQPISSTSFPCNATAMSPILGNSLVVGLSNGTLQLVDSRSPPQSSSVKSSKLPNYALDLLAQNYSVYVTGRFPSLLMYDIRKLSSVARSEYSGAHSLCCLTAARGGIVAAGAYAGRGTLEYYGSQSQQLNWVNRYSAARSTVLSLCVPDWTDELVMAGAADGGIRLLDTAKNGQFYRQLGTATSMVTRIEQTGARSAVILSGGRLRTLTIGDKKRYEGDDSISHQDKHDENITIEQQEQQEMKRQADVIVRRAVQRDMYGMSSLNSFLVSSF
ncbi:hypothetical protein V1514DRAFT_369590 [Lipomyces japonicus]|uniref:uncharacterized protein n=1 Tax=Lipomyces japonicus TaxID=56871 RepID=UPI0034CE517F